MFGNYGLHLVWKGGNNMSWFIFRWSDGTAYPVDGGFSFAYEAHRAMVELEVNQRLFDVCNPC